MKNVPILLGLLAFGISLKAQVALVRHAPTINGRVEGAIHQMSAESVTINGGGVVTDALLVPGTPTVQLNGNPTYGGTLDGTGDAAPSNYKISLNGMAELGLVHRRTDPVSLPMVIAPPLPAGSRSVTINHASETPGDFATIKNLTLGASVGQILVPSGTYGTFTAGAGSGFVLGIAGATTPTVYNFQSLALQSNSSFTLIGPVVVTVASGFSPHANLGEPSRPEWLKLRFSTGGLVVAGNRSVYADLEAPDGELALTGGSNFVGAVASDRLMVGGNALLRLVTSAVNEAPTVEFTAPANGASFTAPASFTLAATATDADGSVFRVEFYSGAMKLGEDASAPYELSISGLAAGSHTFVARAIDNEGSSADSVPLTVTVNGPNQPPVVTLEAPADGALYIAPVTLVLAATATDGDGSVGRVEFFVGTTKIGEDTIAPYEIVTDSLMPGTYQFKAAAIDNLNATGVSAVVTVTVVAPNEAPSVALVAPADGSAYTAPADFVVIATAADSDGSVESVAFFQDGMLLGTDTSAPFEWPITALTSGTYNFLARATDNGGLATDSASVTVTVSLPVSLSLPFVTGFEWAEGYPLGSLHGRQGWVASSQAFVTDADFADGNQSALLPGNDPLLSLSRAFDPHPGQPVVFVDLYALPLAAASEAASARITTLNAAQVAFVREGAAGRFSVFNGASEDWQKSLATVSLDEGGYSADWIRLTLRLDYATAEWDLYVGGSISAAKLGFPVPAAKTFGALALTGHSTAPILIDEVLVAFDNPLFADADRDGMDDTWEAANSLNPAANDRNGDPDADGLVNVLEYLFGTDPQGSDFDGDGMPDGWEWRYGLNPKSNDSAGDPDGDGQSNFIEFLQGRNPQKGAVPDTGGAVKLRIFRPAN